MGPTEKGRRPVPEAGTPHRPQGLGPGTQVPFSTLSCLSLSFLSCQKSGEWFARLREAQGTGSPGRLVLEPAHRAGNSPRMFAFQLVTYPDT